LLISIWKQKDLISYCREHNESDYTKFEAVRQLLQSEYLEPEKLAENKERMLEKAIAGFVGGLDDPYTVYLTSEENKQLENILKEESGIEGIGAVVEKKDTYIQISEIIKNGPAYKAGLQPLDRILLIDNGSTQDLSVHEAVAQIRGEKGTQVQLFIQRLNKNQEVENFQISITRESIEIPSVVATLIEEQETKI